MPGTRHQAPGAWLLQAPGTRHRTWYLAPAIWYQVPCTWLGVAGTRYLVPGWCLVPSARGLAPGAPSARCQAPGAQYQALGPGARHQVPSSRCLASSARYQLTKYLVPRNSRNLKLGESRIQNSEFSAGIRKVGFFDSPEESVLEVQK